MREATLALCAILAGCDSTPSKAPITAEQMCVLDRSEPWEKIPSVPDNAEHLLALADETRVFPNTSISLPAASRASILARARFIEDLVAEQVFCGIGQYVLLGAGLDTFTQRRPELASRLRIFELDQPGPQEWKRQRLVDVGLGVPACLELIPVDFEAGDDWWERLLASGFNTTQPAVVTSTGVSMYLTKKAVISTLHQVAALAPDSTLGMLES